MKSLLLAGIGTLLLLVGGVVIALTSPMGIAPNEWGDLFSGLVAPFALLWLILSIQLQVRELKINNDELQASRRHWETSLREQRGEWIRRRHASRPMPALQPVKFYEDKFCKHVVANLTNGGIPCHISHIAASYGIAPIYTNRNNQLVPLMQLFSGGVVELFPGDSIAFHLIRMQNGEYPLGITVVTRAGESLEYSWRIKKSEKGHSCAQSTPPTLNDELMALSSDP